MIFILHYILFSSGLVSVIILQALYLQRYSDASLSEIGTLLMILPFLSIFVRPFFCALADRQQAHKFYLMGACFFMALGYGSLTVAPFFPEFIEEHGRMVWYLDIVFVVIGYSAFSVVFSLGDALAINAARKNSVSWASYRVWSTLSWGVCGFVVGLINETPSLPKYVPGFFVLICSMIIEIVLLAVWPNSYFDMNDLEVEGASEKQQSPQQDNSNITNHNTIDNWASNGSLKGTIDAHANPKLVAAMATMVMGDLGSTIKSSLKLGQKQKRAGLAEILDEHNIKSNKKDSIIDETKNQAQDRESTIVNLATKERGTIGKLRGFELGSFEQADDDLKSNAMEVEEAKKMEEDLQMILLKLIVKRNPDVLKYLVILTVLGFLLAVHLSYFFIHVEQICREQNEDFSSVMGYLVAAQSFSEVFSFIVIVRYYMPLVGRTGSLITSVALLLIRYSYYGTYYPQTSPYTAIITESAHGFAYGMLYMLIADCATSSVEELDDYLPELIATGLVSPTIDSNKLKLPLRATMQGVFSGAFDGLGFGLGALVGGIYLDFYDLSGLWQICSYICIIFISVYGLTRIGACLKSRR